MPSSDSDYEEPDCLNEPLSESPEYDPSYTSSPQFAAQQPFSANVSGGTKHDANYSPISCAYNGYTMCTDNMQLALVGSDWYSAFFRMPAPKVYRGRIHGDLFNVQDSHSLDWSDPPASSNDSPAEKMDSPGGNVRSDARNKALQPTQTQRAAGPMRSKKAERMARLRARKAKKKYFRNLAIAKRESERLKSKAQPGRNKQDAGNRRLDFSDKS